MKSTIIDIETIIVHVTDKAVLVKDSDDDDPVWLPLSQIELEGEPGEIGTITLPEWLAIERGLI